MRPTRRGYGALSIVVLAMAMAWLAGPRALNALAAPVLVALFAGVVQLWWAGDPTVERTEPRRGFPGERRTVELHVAGAGVARFEDALSAGLDGDTTGEGTLPTSAAYEVTLTGRGEQTLGPVAVVVRDALGLVETRTVVEDTTTVLVFPDVSVVDGEAAFPHTVGPVFDRRTEFDGLREYVPGDRLRDVHWTSTAKRDELLVKTYTEPVDEEAISIVAEADSGHADAMAAAAASLVVAAIRAGLAVELAVPDGRLERRLGRAHQMAALELLARTGPGSVTGDGADGHHDADVRISATNEGVTVATGGRHRRMTELTVRDENPLRSRGTTA